MDYSLTTPVAYVIFNRPDCVRKSFESIRKARPQRLFIIADGPREDHDDDPKLCDECRTIVENVDWDCEVLKNYSEINLGCGLRPSTGFSWVFSQTDRAIIIEDDCVPSMDFYRFCQEMLERYKDDARIYSVSGMNFNFISDNEADYYFTHYNNTWGWATWKRVWDQYDFELKSFYEDDCDDKFNSIMLEKAYVKFWKHHFKRAYDQADNTAWDYQFTYLSLMNGGLHIYPQKNLVAYIGFSYDATHTVSIKSDHRLYYSTKESNNISFPLRHPTAVQADFRIDYLIMKEIFNVSSDDLKICKELPLKVVDNLKKHKNIIIYGAGEVCRDVIKLLGNEHIDKFRIAVTRLKDNEKIYIMGNEVHEISEYKSITEDSIVLLAVTKMYEDEIVDHIEKLGFHNYIRLGIQTENQIQLEKYRKLPLDGNKIVLLTTNDGSGHGRNIVQALLKQKPDCDIVWFVHNADIPVPKGVRKVLYRDSLSYTRELLTAKIWLADTGVPISMKKEGQIYIQMKHWSSITLKMFGYDELQYRGEEDVDKFGVHGLDEIDYVLVGSEFDERTCRSGFRFNGAVKYVGSPRTDTLFHESGKYDGLKERVGIKKTERCLLFAPTYRIAKKGSIDTVYTNQLDFDAVRKALVDRFGCEWRILLRFHPFVADMSGDMNYPDFVTDVSDYYDSEELVAISDIMITDYSSIMFEPAFIKRPVFLFADDREEYLTKERGFLIDYDSLPFPIAETNKQLAENILNFDQEKYESDVTAFLDKYGVHEDGNASERAAEFILGLMG